MFFVTAPLFIVFVIFALMTLFGTGIASYVFLIEEGRKALAEGILFASLVSALLLIIAVVYMVFFSRRKVHNMEKIIDTARTSGVLAQDRFKEFGSLGMSLRILYRETLEISERRAARIFLLNHLCTYLLGFINEPLIIIDTTGKILYMTHNFLQQFEADSQPQLSSLITDIYPKLDFKSVLKKAELSHSTVDTETDKGIVRFIPVHGKSNTPDIFCVTFGKNSLFSLPKIAFSQKNEEKKHGLFDLFRKKENNAEQAVQKVKPEKPAKAPKPIKPSTLVKPVKNEKIQSEKEIRPVVLEKKVVPPIHAQPENDSHIEIVE